MRSSLGKAGGDEVNGFMPSVLVANAKLSTEEWTRKFWPGKKNTHQPKLVG
jgi:hypothetical protein